jgi:hypothetical protein
MKLPDMFLDFWFDEEGSLKGLPRNDVAMELLQGLTNMRADFVDWEEIKKLQLMGTVLLKKRGLDVAAGDPVYSDLGPQDAPMRAMAQIRAERGLQKMQQDADAANAPKDVQEMVKNASESNGYAVGDAVVLHGLTKQAELNGCRGVVRNPAPKPGRVGIEVDGKTIAVPLEKVKKVA